MDTTVPANAPGEPPGRRRRGLLAVAGVAAGVLVLGTAGAVALSRVGGDASAAGVPSSAGGLASSPAVGLTPGAAEPADATDTATPPPLPPSQPTLVLGDSLGLIVYPWLADLLPDRYVSYQAEVGRSTPGTERILDQMGSVPPVVIVSSGTNDPVANVLEESARRILDTLGPARCVVWVDVVRPDRVGDSQTMMNAALDRAVSGRPNVRVLHWTDLVAAHPEWMSGDGIHPGQDGAQARAQAFAAAAEACSALDPNAPRAARQYLPPSAFWGPVSGQYRAPSTPQGNSTSGRSSGGASGTSSSSGPSTPATSGTTSPSTPGTAASSSSPPDTPASSPAASTGTSASAPSTATQAAPSGSG